MNASAFIACRKEDSFEMLEIRAFQMAMSQTFFMIEAKQLMSQNPSIKVKHLKDFFFFNTSYFKF